MARRFKDKGYAFAAENFDEKPAPKVVNEVLDRLLQYGPYDLVYCTIGNYECDFAHDHMNKKGYEGKFLTILLDERL